MQDMRHFADETSFLSRFLFYWQLPIGWKITNKKITNNDFIVAPKILGSKFLGEKLEVNWNKQKTLKEKRSLARALFQTFSTELLLGQAFYLPFDVAIAVLQPVYLRKLLNYFTLNQTAVTKHDAYFYGSMITLALVLKVFSFQFFLLHCTTTGIKMRTACSSLIYRRLLTIRKPTLQKITSAYIVNLFSSNVDRFDRGLAPIQVVCISVIKLIVLAIILYIWGDWKSTVGIIVLYGFLFCKGFIGKIISHKTMKTAVETDHRIRIISDVISGIRTIKMYAWEKYFSESIKVIRREELRHVSASNHIQSATTAASFYFPKFPVYIYILLAVLTNSLDVKLVFMAISIMDQAKVALQFANNGLNDLSELITGVHKVQEFLIQTEEDEIQTQKCCGQGITARNLNVKWDASLVLRNIDLKVFSGQLVAIVGAAGSGKSTLLQAILNEPIIVTGTLEVGEFLSYASQEPWIIPATLKENIVFGEKENESKYRTVLRVCALEHDVSLFPYGDNTLVGERGVMLSGGQKARVGLARAVYKDSDIYLLDDPLAAVDASVATQIFTECILGYLKTKTVVLVTHQLKFLKSVDKIYILEDGTVKSRGDYESLQAFIGKSLQSYEEKQSVSSELKEQNENQVEIKEDEGCSTMNRYKFYLLASGRWSLLLQVLLFILYQCSMNASDLFLTFWINTKESSSNSNFFTDLNSFYFYTGILLSLILLSHLSTWFFIECGQIISFNLHKNLFDKTLQASMMFFDNHSSGRLLSRFSRDMGVVDEVIPRVLYDLIRLCGAVLCVCMIVAVVSYWMVFLAAALLLIFCILTWLFSPSLTFLRKTAALRKSPIFTHIATTIRGLSTIKALEAESKMLSSYHQTQNFFNSVEYMERAISFCYAFWTDVFCALYTILIVFITVNIKDTGVGNVGLALTQSFLLMWSAQYATKLYGQLDSFMTSVERVVKYADLDVENNEGDIHVPDSWPSEGRILFDSLSLRYQPDKPLVLNQIDLAFQPGEKIGIVGRTGSGKSSLVSTLFRLYNFEGTILIDGVDIKQLSLDTLRNRLAVIPQDPVFFPGSLRQNLDPFAEFEDSRLWNVLNDVKLTNFVSNLPSGLESLILEGGGNFSVGQRQLLCLVRAILKNAKIVVFDEATANVDFETDELIQTTIRRRFEKSTVLTIAHRLDTIMNSDKILVMEDGRVAEFGVTRKLLQDVDSIFYKLANHK